MLFLFYNNFWSSEEHIRSSYVCSFFCGRHSMRTYQFRSDILKWKQQNSSQFAYQSNLSETTSEQLGQDDNVVLPSDEYYSTLDNGLMKTIYPSAEDRRLHTWFFIVTPSLFNWVPLCIMLICYCLIWVKIKRSDSVIQGMVAFNKHKNEVCYN